MSKFLPRRRLRIYVGERDKAGWQPLYLHIIELAHKAGLAGATAFRGIASFGISHRLHMAHVLRLSEDLPITIEILDTAARIDDFLTSIEPLLEQTHTGMLTMEDVLMRPLGGNAD
jgi:hypothetical protein